MEKGHKNGRSHAQVYWAFTGFHTKVHPNGNHENAVVIVLLLV